jgi:hypothetical protein
MNSWFWFYHLLRELRGVAFLMALALAWLIGLLGSHAPGTGETLDVERDVERRGQGFALSAELDPLPDHYREIAR